jgi:hypothetical protein
VINASSATSAWQNSPAGPESYRFAIFIHALQIQRPRGHHQRGTLLAAIGNQAIDRRNGELGKLRRAVRAHRSN